MVLKYCSDYYLFTPYYGHKMKQLIMHLKIYFLFRGGGGGPIDDVDVGSQIRCRVVVVDVVLW